MKLKDKYVIYIGYQNDQNLMVEMYICTHGIWKFENLKIEKFEKKIWKENLKRKFENLKFE